MRGMGSRWVSGRQGGEGEARVRGEGRHVEATSEGAPSVERACNIRPEGETRTEECVGQGCWRCHGGGACVVGQAGGRMGTWDRGGAGGDSLVLRSLVVAGRRLRWVEGAGECVCVTDGTVTAKEDCAVRDGNGELCGVPYCTRPVVALVT